MFFPPPHNTGNASTRTKAQEKDQDAVESDAARNARRVRAHMIREYVRSRLRGRFGAPSLKRAGQSHIAEWWIGRDAPKQPVGDAPQGPALHVCLDDSRPGRARITIFDPASQGDSVVEEVVRTEAEADQLIQRLERIAGCG